MPWSVLCRQDFGKRAARHCDASGRANVSDISYGIALDDSVTVPCRAAVKVMFDTNLHCIVLVAGVRWLSGCYQSVLRISQVPVITFDCACAVSSPAGQLRDAAGVVSTHGHSGKLGEGVRQVILERD